MRENNIAALKRKANVSTDNDIDEVVRYRVNHYNAYKITKRDYKVLVAAGYINELEPHEIKFGYGNTTPKCDSEEKVIISSKLGGLGYYLIFEHNKKVFEYIFSCKSDCYYPFFYRLYA